VKVDPTVTQTFRLRLEGTVNGLYDGGHLEYFDNQVIGNIALSGDVFGLGGQGQLVLNSTPDLIAGSFPGTAIIFMFSASSSPSGFTPLTCSIANSMLSCQSNDGNGNFLDIENDGSAAASLQVQNSTSGSLLASIYVDLFNELGAFSGYPYRHREGKRRFCACDKIGFEEERRWKGGELQVVVYRGVFIIILNVK
jgi:hypothetical protein